jgi:ketosteroid isomerase-like protein
MNIDAELIERVCELVGAENDADRGKAEGVLAPDFVAITRGTGAEQGREALLNQIKRPPSPNPRRVPVDGEFQVWASGDLGVVRSLIRTEDRASGTVLGTFRNVHVLQKQQGEWVIVDWQVTPLKP